MAKNDNLKDFVTDIANAIREKKGTTEPINPQNFSSEIASISGAENLDAELNEQESLLAEVETAVNELTDKPADTLQQLVDGKKTCKYLCERYSGTDMNFINGLDTSEATDMSYMFYYCSALTSLNLSNFNTDKVKDMSNMFAGCSKLTSLDLSSFNTSNVTNMTNMFYTCTELLSLNIKGWDLSKVTNMSYFLYNTKVQEIDFTGVDTSKVTNMSSMFGNSKIKTIKNLDMVSVTSNNNLTGFVTYSSELENLYIKNIRANLDIGYYAQYGAKYSDENLVYIANELWNFTGATSHRLSLSTNAKTAIQNIHVKLVEITDEMRANDQYIDNKLPCVVCESTDAGAMTLEEYIVSKNWTV